MSERTINDSPFPGMDPYVERYWGDVHARLIVYASDSLQRILPDGLYARVEQHVRLESMDDVDDDERRFPDIAIVGTAPTGLAASAVAVAEMADPVVVSMEPHPSTVRYVAIADRDRDDRLVTAIELISPGNKEGAAAREEYRDRCRELLETGASLVEIDLVRSGGYVLSAPPEKVRTVGRGPYNACVRRARRTHRAEVYDIGMRAALPTLRVPLRPGDADVPLVLQSMFAQAYTAGAYGRTIDYTRDPVPPLEPDDAAWADALLKSKELR
jgi:hypothetical protein